MFYRRKIIRGSDKHDFRQIVRNFEIVVSEFNVLNGVEHLEQSARRIALHIVINLIYLIEEKQRIRGLRVVHTRYDTSGHCSDVSSPVSSYLRLVVDTAETHLDIFLI